MAETTCNMPYVNSKWAREAISFYLKSTIYYYLIVRLSVYDYACCFHLIVRWFRTGACVAWAWNLVCHLLPNIHLFLVELIGWVVIKTTVVCYTWEDTRCITSSCPLVCLVRCLGFLLLTYGTKQPLLHSLQKKSQHPLLPCKAPCPLILNTYPIVLPVKKLILKPLKNPSRICWWFLDWLLGTLTNSYL